MALSKCSREMWLSFLQYNLPLSSSHSHSLSFSSVFHLTISLFLTLAFKIKIIEWTHSFLNRMYWKPEKQRWYVNLKKKKVYILYMLVLGAQVGKLLCKIHQNRSGPAIFLSSFALNLRVYVFICYFLWIRRFELRFLHVFVKWLQHRSN